MEKKANEDLCNIVAWLYAYKLSLNIKKTLLYCFTSGDVNIMEHKNKKTSIFLEYII